MGKLLRQVRFLMYVPIFSSLLAGLIALGLGVWKVVQLALVVVTEGPAGLVPLHFLRVMDAFVISAVLILFAIGLYVLFLGKLNLPETYQARSLHDLESKMGNLIILALALYVLERFIESPGDLGLVFLAGAFLMVTAGIVAFTTLSKPTKTEEES